MKRWSFKKDTISPDLVASVREGGEARQGGLHFLKRAAAAAGRRRTPPADLIPTLHPGPIFRWDSKELGETGDSGESSQRTCFFLHCLLHLHSTIFLNAQATLAPTPVNP